MASALLEELRIGAILERCAGCRGCGSRTEVQRVDNFVRQFGFITGQCGGYRLLGWLRRRTRWVSAAVFLHQDFAGCRPQLRCCHLFGLRNSRHVAMERQRNQPAPEGFFFLNEIKRFLMMSPGHRHRGTAVAKTSVTRPKGCKSPWSNLRADWSEQPPAPTNKKTE